MSSSINLIVLAPFILGIASRYLVNKRLKSDFHNKAPKNTDENQIFTFPRTYVDIIFYLGIIFPTIIYFLPASIVLDFRYIFNIFALLLSLLLFFSWAYLRYYKIIVDIERITYGSFWMRHIILHDVTKIKYHWVNNGIYLKLYSEKKILAKFEGGVANFDYFAKCVISKLPKSIQVETVGRASSH